MNAGVTGAVTVMQANHTTDLDNNGSFETVYVRRFNFPTSTYVLSDGTTIAGAVNFIKVTTGGVASQFLIAPDSIATQLDTYNITPIHRGGTMATSANTDGANFNNANLHGAGQLCADRFCIGRQRQSPTAAGFAPAPNVC